MRTAERWLLAGAVVAAAVVKARFPWVPVWYLVVLLLAGSSVWWGVRRGAAPRGRRWAVLSAGSLVTLALCPVPWMVAADGAAPGNAWRLDGRISIEGRSVDPAGTWLWLTAGRPPTVAELAWSKLRPTAEPVGSMRAGALRKRARWSEPAAAAVGLARGGWDIGTRLEAHVAGPDRPGLPERAVVVAVNGTPIAHAAAWRAALDALGEHNTLTTADGDVLAFAGPEFPYRSIDTVVTPTRRIDVVVGGRLARTPAGRWWRNLATGSSHGLMVALVAYVHASGEQLGAGLTLAGTGSIRPDGSVGRIGGLPAKAAAARDAGADVLLYPADQAADLAGFDARSMQLVGVTTLDEAITALRSRRAG